MMPPLLVLSVGRGEALLWVRDPAPTYAVQLDTGETVAQAVGFRRSLLSLRRPVVMRALTSGFPASGVCCRLVQGRSAWASGLLFARGRTRLDRRVGHGDKGPARRASSGVLAG